MKEWIRKIAGLVSGWLDELLFPDNVLCLCCDRALSEDAKDGVCSACAKALARLNEKREEWERTHDVKAPEGIACVHAAYPYEGPARQMVHRLKYDCVRMAHIPLARPMVFLSSGEEELIVPVPTDPGRKRRRGFNQAELLADYMGRELGMRVVPALRRTQRRRPQTGLSAQQRRQNLKNCMAADASVSGKRVLLVDDVYTTGSTAQEAARALLQAGAVSVRLMTACRTTDELLGETDPFALG